MNVFEIAITAIIIIIIIITVVVVVTIIVEVISNNKFKAFSSANINFRDQKLVIDFKLLPNNHPDFEVKIINKYGHNMTQGGGASQILRQLSLIFGLIEKSEGSVDYPFIADAHRL